MVLVLALVASAWLFIDWFRDDVRQIERALRRVQRIAAKAPTESELAGLAKARRIAEALAEPFLVRVPSEGVTTSDRDRLVAAIHRFRSRTSAFIVQIESQEVYLDARGEGANVILHARFINDVEDLTGGTAYLLRLHWIKDGGTWLVDDAELVSGRE